jgi:hypothetical protein
MAKPKWAADKRAAQKTKHYRARLDQLARDMKREKDAGHGKSGAVQRQGAQQ